MLEPFDKHDQRIRGIAMELTPTRHKGEPMGKLVSESIRLLEKAMNEWRDSCPGAGWEHHQTSAVVTLAMTPSMQKLLEMAAIGYAVQQADAQTQPMAYTGNSSPLEAERDG
jgi:hypothetical protein